MAEQLLLAGVLTAEVPLGAAAAGQAHTRQLAAVRARSVAVVDAMVGVLAPGALDATYAAAEPAAVAGLRAAWTGAATTATTNALSAAAAWDAAAPDAGLSTVPGVPAGLLPDAAGTAAQLRLTVLIEAKQRIAAGTGPEQALEHARQRAGRAAAGIGARAARTAHERALQVAGLGWARIPRTNGCPWCLLLASRGPVYRSERTAQGRVGPYHPWCRCGTLAVPRGLPVSGYLDPGSDVGALVDQAAAAWDATGTMDRYTASTFAREQERARRGRTPTAPQVPAQRTGPAGSGAGGSPPPPTLIASGGEHWDHPDHVRAMRELDGLLTRRRTKAVGGLDEALAELERVRQDLRITGVIDEQFKTFSADERRIAQLLAAEGANVTALLESTVQNVKTADAAVGRIRTEFKTLTSRKHFEDELTDAADKSLEAVVDVTGMRITRQAAARIAEEQMRGTSLRRVRILGRAYDGRAYDVWVERPRGKKR